MKIIAERDKTFGKILLVFGVLLIVLSAFLLGLSLWYIATLILGAVIGLISIFDLSLPKKAILKDGEYFIIRYAFSEIRIKASEIEYVKCDEIGEFRYRKSFLGFLHVLKNDVRRLNITVNKDGLLKHYQIWSIINASATVTAIESIIDNEKKNKN